MHRDDFESPAARACKGLHLADLGECIWIDGVDQQADGPGAWDELQQQIEFLCFQFAGKIGDACYVSTRPVQPRD